MNIFEGIGQKERDLFSEVIGKLEYFGGYYYIEEKGWIMKRNEWTFRYKDHRLVVDGLQLTYMNTFYTVINCIKGWLK